jgi:vacuolar-type H+-ATPase subunit E/Vma4
MALDDLIAVLDAEARGRAATWVEGARREAATLVDGAARRRDRTRAEALAAAEAAERTELGDLLGEARRRAALAILTSRERALDRIFEAAARAAGEAMASEEYRRALPALLAAALDFARPGPGVRVRCAPVLADALRGFAGEGGLRADAVEVDPAVGAGFEVTSADGRLTVAERLDERLARLRPGLAIAVVQEIDEEDRP